MTKAVKPPKDPATDYQKRFATRTNNIYSTVNFLNGREVPPVQSRFIRKLQRDPKRAKRFSDERFKGFDRYLEELVKAYDGEFQIARVGGDLERYNLDRKISRENANKINNRKVN